MNWTSPVHIYVFIKLMIRRGPRLLGLVLQLGLLYLQYFMMLFAYFLVTGFSIEEVKKLFEETRPGRRD